MNFNIIRNISSSTYPKDNFSILSIGLNVCLNVMFLVPLYMGMKEKEGMWEGGDMICGCCKLSIHIFHSCQVMWCWALIILFPLPPTMKWSPIEGFWWWRYQNIFFSRGFSWWHLEQYYLHLYYFSYKAM